MDEILKKTIAAPTVSVKQAMEKLDEAANKIIFITDDDNTLIGVVTDGDIRRFILKNGNLNEPVSKVMNKNPKVLKQGFDIKDAKELMKNELIECLPVVDSKKRVVSAIWWSDFFRSKFIISDKVKAPVVIMAGGKGTRLDPFTKVLPKPLIPIGEKTIIEMIIDRFNEFGCREFYVSINYKASMIKAYFTEMSDNKNYDIDYLEEKEFLGTAGSLTLLKKRKINVPFFVNNCDILIEANYSDILKTHKEEKNFITIVSSLKNFKIPYGVIETEKNGSLKDIKEKPEFNFLVNTGMYVMQPEVLDDIPENKFYHVTDLINDYKIKGKKIGVYPISEKSWTDIGQMGELYDAFKKFGV